MHYQNHEAVRRLRLASVYYRTLRQDTDFCERLTACYHQLDTVPEHERRAVAEENAKTLHVRADDLLYSFSIWQADTERLYLVPSLVFTDFPDASVHVEATLRVHGSVYWKEDRDRLLAELEKQYRAVREELLRQIDEAEKRLRDAGLSAVHPRYENAEDLERKATVLFYRLHRRMSYGEIAVKLQCPRSTVQRLLTEARNVLGI
ncbi:hypothetical protein HRbin16_03056 [bacterium HR16]|nr:hypothetical protein HRbin16_03056 [bacterium HR16]